MYVIMALVLFLGIDFYFNMPREEYPEIKENIVFVSSIYPGNTAEDIEKLITEPLEDKLKSVNNIIEIKSSSKENLSLIIIEFDDGIGYTEAKLKVKDEVESAVAGEDWPRVNFYIVKHRPIFTSYCRFNFIFYFKFSFSVSNSIIKLDYY